MITMDEKQETNYLTPEQVARRLNFKERKVMDMLRSGKIPGVKIGKDWRISPADLEAFIERSKRK